MPYTQSSMSSRGASSSSYVGYILVAILFTALGMGMGMFVFSSGGGSSIEKGDYQEGYEAAMKEAEEKLQAKGYIPQDPLEGDLSNAEVGGRNFYNGTVVELKGDAITISFPSFNPLEDDIVKSFPVGSSAEIVLQKEKDFAIFEEELAQYEASREPTEPEEGTSENDDEVFVADVDAMPQPFVEESFSLSQMREGDNVEILVGEDGNTVEKITVFSLPEIEAPLDAEVVNESTLPVAPDSVEADPQDLPEAPEAL